MAPRAHLALFVTVLYLATARESSASPDQARLLVDVVPSLDPAGKPWRVELLEARDGRYQLTSDEPAPARRAVELRPVEGRAYVLRLRSSDGDLWMTDPEPFVAGKGPATRTLEPKAERVRGLVTVGKRPLGKAHLTFSTGPGLESVSISSKEDGTFTGFLPHLGRWHLAATSSSLHIHRELDMSVERNNHGNELDAEVQLIPEGLEGELVDIENERVSFPAHIYLRPLDGSSWHRDERVEGGVFRVGRLDDGRYQAQVHGSIRLESGALRLMTSEPQMVIVEHGTADPAWLSVVMRRPVPWNGRVVTATGAGVPNASVQRILSAWGTVAFLGARATSDADGKFQLPVPEGLPDACLAIVPRELPTALTRMARTDDEQVIPISGPGGTLLVDQPYAGAERLEGRRVVLVHAGCAVFPGSLRYLRRPKATPFTDTGARWRIEIPNLEPGSYAACAMTWDELAAFAVEPRPLGECLSGVLAPGGRLELTLP